jgi:hypothetical protein
MVTKPMNDVGMLRQLTAQYAYDQGRIVRPTYGDSYNLTDDTGRSLLRIAGAMAV